jgi:23S rRNA (uracil1939-C5)-methyltransferase
VAQIARGPKPHLIYVSCNPVALERDARALREAGYVLTSATAIDQFLWSPHIEAVVGFAPPKKGR